MDPLIATLGILGGSIAVIVGLLMIAPQVKVHQINIHSWGSWWYRVGAGLTMIGLVVNLVSSRTDALTEVGVITGVAGLMGGIITWGHERRQALDHGADRWDWSRSLTLQMVVLGGLVLLIALMG